VGDIEKLIKKKLDIESFELEDDRPRRSRVRDDADEGRAPSAHAERDEGVRATREAREVRERPAREPDRPRRAPADPFFDKPYEPTGSGDASWDKAAAPAPSRSPLSPNIRPKKRVASLLGGKT
jgi:hypothetical protein